jgi:G3E family GTPase
VFTVPFTLLVQVTVVDGPSMLKDWSTGDLLKERKWQRGEDDERSVVDLLTDQLEFADVCACFACNAARISILCISAVTHARHPQVIIINKIDLMTPEEVQSLSAFIRTFNAVAKIVETQRSRVPLADVVNSRIFSMQRAEKMKGWLARARGDVQPESEEYTFASLSQAMLSQLVFSSLSAHALLPQVRNLVVRVPRPPSLPPQAPAFSHRRLGRQRHI